MESVDETVINQLQDLVIKSTIQPEQKTSNPPLLSTEELKKYILKLAEDLESDTLSEPEKLVLSELYMKKQSTDKNILDLKYFTLGWYIYEYLLDKSESTG
jgi:hypothetical protein